MRITIELRRPILRRPVAIAIALILLAAPAIVVASHQFSDVPASNQFHGDIDALADAGVTAGCGGGKYCPKDNVTREQMAAFMNRLGALAPGKTPVVNAAALNGQSADDFLSSATYVVSDSGTAEPGTGATVVVSCDSGDIALAGGVSDVAKTSYVTDSFPHPVNAGSWSVFVANDAESDTVTVFVRCADLPPRR